MVGVGAVFTLARFSEAFLVLRARQTGIPPALVPLVMAAMNVIYAASAYPFGKLSDAMSHRKLLGPYARSFASRSSIAQNDCHGTHAAPGR